MRQPLSEILTAGPEFHFFTAVAHLEPFDLRTLEHVIDDMFAYTGRVQDILGLLGAASSDEMNYQWLLEGRDKFYEIYRNVDSVDSVVLQALNLLETNLQESQMADTNIFDKLDELSQRSLDVKGGYLVQLKAKIDVSVEYNDIYNLMMSSINNELEHCLKKCFKIHEKRFSSPVRHAPSFNLEILTKKLLRQRNQLRLPLLNEIDNELYEEYLELKTIVDPLKASLSFIPLRIEDFKQKYGETNFADTRKITDKYEALMKEMQFLQNEVNDLKYELVEKRWSEIFSYLNTEMSFLVTNVEREIIKMEMLDDDSAFKTQLYNRLKYTTDIVESTFILINQAIDEELIDFKTMEKSNELAAQWLDVKNKIPKEYLDKIENDEKSTNDNDTMTNNFKKLSLEQTCKKVSDEDQAKRVPSAEDRSKKEKRKSMYGQFLFDKMNIQAVMIEGDPTSVKKPEEINSAILLPNNGTSKEYVDSTPSKSKETISDYKRPEDLKNTLSQNIPNLAPDDLLSNHELTSSNRMASPTRRGLFAQLSPIIDDTPSRDIHQDTFAQLMGQSPEMETPAPRRHIFSETVILSSTEPKLTQSKIPIPLNTFKSRIPRPASRLNVDRPPSRSSGVRVSDRQESRLGSGRSSSSLGSRLLERPSTSHSSSRTSRLSMQAPSPNTQRHTMFPQTPVRSVRSSRSSLIPQPTPLREIIERGASRLGGRPTTQLSMRSNTGLSLAGSSRSSSVLGSRDLSTKPTWR